MKKQNENNSSQVASFFDANWDHYQTSVHNNALYHVEMFSALDELLSERFKGKRLTLADLGSGDSSAILPVLINHPIKRYIGVDAAEQLIDNAKKILVRVDCEKEFICADMAGVIEDLSSPIDVILTSYALHHLSYDNKVRFIKDCQNKLESGGIFILIDGVLAINQNRDAWLKELEKHIIESNPGISEEEADAILVHPRRDDFPETIATFKKIAEAQKWKKFEVLVDKEMYAFMAFTK